MVNRIKIFKNYILNFLRIIYTYSYLETLIFEISHFFGRIYRSFQFAKYAYSTYDWDYIYIVDIMIFKMERMHDNFKYHGVAEHKDDLKQIKATIKLLRRVKDYDYEDKYYKALDKKWGKFPTGRDGFWKGSRSKVKTPADKKAYLKDVKALIKNSHKDRTQDLRAAFKIMEKHIWSWWD